MLSTRPSRSPTSTRAASASVAVLPRRSGTSASVGGSVVGVTSVGVGVTGVGGVVGSVGVVGSRTVKVGDSARELDGDLDAVGDQDVGTRCEVVGHGRVHGRLPAGQLLPGLGDPPVVPGELHDSRRRSHRRRPGRPPLVRARRRGRGASSGSRSGWASRSPRTRRRRPERAGPPRRPTESAGPRAPPRPAPPPRRAGSSRAAPGARRGGARLGRGGTSFVEASRTPVARRAGICTSDLRRANHARPSVPIARPDHVDAARIVAVRRLDAIRRDLAGPPDTPDRTGTPLPLQRQGCAGLPGSPGNPATISRRAARAPRPRWSPGRAAPAPRRRRAGRSCPRWRPGRSGR